MSKKTSICLGDQQKALYEWAQDAFFENGGEVSRFLHFIKQEGKEPMEVVSYTDFLTLKEKFDPDSKGELGSLNFNSSVKKLARNLLLAFFVYYFKSLCIRKTKI